MDRIIETMEDEMNKGFWDPEIMPVFLDILRNRPNLLKLPERTTQDKSAAIFEEISKTGALEWEK